MTPDSRRNVTTARKRTSEADPVFPFSLHGDLVAAVLSSLPFNPSRKGEEKLEQRLKSGQNGQKRAPDLVILGEDKANFGTAQEKAATTNNDLCLLLEKQTKDRRRATRKTAFNSSFFFKGEMDRPKKANSYMLYA